MGITSGSPTQRTTLINTATEKSITKIQTIIVNMVNLL